MTDATPGDLEGLLRRAMAPIEPPPRLVEQFEQKLEDLADLAVEELEGWELSAMRDPRNWVRPVIAAGVGATAGTALVLIRVRRRGRKHAEQSSDVGDLAGRILRDMADEARRLFDR